MATGLATDAPTAPRAHSSVALGSASTLVFLDPPPSGGHATLLVASFFVFLATNALPGNVAKVILGRNATPAAVTALDQRLGMNRPLLARYGSWLSGAVHGNFGQDAVQLSQGSTSAPVSGVIGRPLLNSLILAALVTVLLIPLSIAVGLISGLHAGRPVDHAVSVQLADLWRVPEFVFGTFLILVFSTGSICWPQCLS